MTAFGATEGLAAHLGNIVRLFAAVRRALGLSHVCLVERGKDGELRVVAYDGEREPTEKVLGRVVDDPGLASAVIRSGQGLVVNRTNRSKVKAPYCSRDVSLKGIVVVPAEDGYVWADRTDSHFSEDEFRVMEDLFIAIVHEAREGASRVDLDRRITLLSEVLEDLRGILAAADEKQCVARLIEAVCQRVGATGGVVVMTDEERFELVVVATYGEQARRLLGARYGVHEGLVGLALKHRTVLPSDYVFTRKMAPILGSGHDLSLDDGTPLLVYPVYDQDRDTGAVVIWGGNFGDPMVTHATRTLSDAAGLLIERFKLERRIQQEAMTDGLTGLYNRQAWTRRLAELFSMCKRYGQRLSVLMLDVDHFKQVNDTYGHLVGDRVLRLISEIVSSNLRAADIAGRYGGEELAVVLPNTDAAGAARVAERIRLLCEKVGVDVGSGKVGATVSIGVAELTPAMQRPEDVIGAADRALYEAKARGRNTVVVA